MKIETSNFNVIKVINKNIVVVYQANIEKILYEKGIGVGKNLGDNISKDDPIEKIFSIENKINYDNFNKLVNTVDDEVIALCEEIIYMISKELNEDLHERVHLSLIHHIEFTLKRIESGENIQNPFLDEIKTLFSEEYKLAQKAAIMIEDKTKIYFPEDEIAFITLHIHAARNDGGLSNAVRYAFVSNTIIKMMEDELAIKIDRKSLAYARFITHIRFTIQRILNNTCLKNKLLHTIKRKYYASFKLAQKISNFAEGELNLKVPEDETAYLAVYIQKFKRSRWKK
ncbi:PRD domain-containing protein [Clostridium bowmanii]|uniref:PRD domain-containing protein n=1 Tax=Clostridium bowmanii TaxID=132925 RepID=UPI001C0B9EBC|nr:PRD domain-containing protein [Clostridium bowmanii]MBU3191816.1 PRD domain-containing protein [Clostridium bowmanii]MCA1076090.1 PRD domain-containing protein [Clostridium bowmanii]